MLVVSDLDRTYHVETEEYSPANFCPEMEISKGKAGYKNNMGGWNGASLKLMSIKFFSWKRSEISF